MSQVQFHTLDPEVAPKLTAWQRSYGVSADGEYYVPAAAAGSEDKVLMAANFDGVSIASFKGHLYVPLSWAKKEFRSAQEVWSAIETHMREFGVVYVK
ncbi:hypothetical protein [Delftia sp. PE138]|uniref:hypothetical protein n=1 Tax=Delftia sp. PE138 TaxID=1812483 RepID=UPI001BAFEA66|nr:hypothetical protein [Delftia sp. PE138]MBS3721187.1 hypothetical protein [Delftia sp. PE138]